MILNDKNAQELFSLNDGFTNEQLKAAYRRLSKKYHPDVNKDPEASFLFRLIQDGYETLGSSRQSTTRKKKKEPVVVNFSVDIDRPKIYEFGDVYRSVAIRYEDILLADYIIINVLVNRNWLHDSGKYAFRLERRDLINSFYKPVIIKFPIKKFYCAVHVK